MGERMSDAPTAEPTTTEPVVEPEPAKAETDWKAEAKKWEQRAKENKTAAERLAQFEEAQKTQAQRDAEAREAAESRATNAEREVTRLRVIAEIGLDADLHEFVVGNDEDEMRAKAEKLKARAASGTAPGPRPDMTQGSRAGNPASSSPAQDFANFLKSATPS